MALMIGVAVVAFFSIFAASIKATINSQIDKSFAGDLVVGSGNFGGGGITPQLATDLAGSPQVDAVSGMRFGVMVVDGDPKQITAADPRTLNKVLDVGVSSGSLAALDDHSLAVGKSAAKDHGWTVGTQLPVRFVDGSTATFTVAALYDNGDVIGNYLVGLSAWQPHAPDSTDFLVAIKLKNGVSISDGKTQLKPLVDREAAGSRFQTRDEFRDQQASQINQFFLFVIVMLLVAIIISLMGIANTLSLSITERTRELGLLRAVGMAREQLRSMIRWEGALISLFGTIGGLGLGILVSWALTSATGENGLKYKLPIGSLIILVILGAVAGTISAVLPARRAARLNVLDAIATE